MAKKLKRKRFPKSDEPELFGAEPEEEPEKRKVLSVSQMKIPKTDVQSGKIYNGIDIFDLTELFKKVAEKYDAEYLPQHWSGSAVISASGSIDNMLSMATEFHDLHAEYNATMFARLSYMEDGVNLSITVPGPISARILA